jgi:hypothetical protein
MIQEDQPQPRGVRFPDDKLQLEIVHLYSFSSSEPPGEESYDEAVRKELWYQQRDFRCFRQAAKLIASSESKKFGLGRFLDGTHESKDGESQCKLQLWARYGHLTRGCEYWCNSAHGNYRKEHKKRMILLVLQTQDETRGSSTATSVLDDVDARAMRIADAAMRHSAVAQRFGRNMGVADAIAILQIADVSLLRSKQSTRSPIFPPHQVLGPMQAPRLSQRRTTQV